MAPAAAWPQQQAAAPPPASWRHAAPDLAPDAGSRFAPDAGSRFAPDAGSRFAADAAADLAPGDHGFIALCQAYRASGGIARGDDLVHWMLGRGQGDSVQLAGLIVGGEAFSFVWRQTFWVPMFQFSPLQPAWGQGARQVLTELDQVLDGWQLAAWFVRPNGWLADQRPLDLLATQLPLVLAAARADRYVVTG